MCDASLGNGSATRVRAASGVVAWLAQAGEHWPEGVGQP
jgi:hypothetical protein